MTALSHVLAASCVLASGCGSEAATGFPQPNVLVDLNEDPAIVEVRLVAEPGTLELLPGKSADVWTFRDGSVTDSPASMPGPMLEATIGDRVIVHFENRLPVDTTIHWHGLRVPNASDGTPIAQMIVAPGGTYDYTFTAVDAGLFWYHPHVAGDVQIERGLYAPIRIRGGVEPDVAADRVIVLDDVKMQASGQLSITTDNLDVMLGRQGNVLLVNGKTLPTLDTLAGSRERWRIVNVANGRYFNLDLPGQRFLVIGWDGGMLSEPYEAETLLVAPGERYDVLVEPSRSAALRNVYYDRGHEIPDVGPVDLVAITVRGEGPAPAALPTVWGSVPVIPIDANTPRRRFVLDEKESGLAEPTFSINGETYPSSTPTVGSVGEVAIWEIENATEMDHPFHLHGMSFQVLDETGLVVPRLGWKDTVNVPRKKIVRFAVRYEAAGRWMYHCHILEHAERGMMGELDLQAP